MRKLPIEEELTDRVPFVPQHRGVAIKEPGLLYQEQTLRVEAMQLLTEVPLKETELQSPEVQNRAEAILP